MSNATTQITLRTAVLIPFVMIFLLAIGVIVYVQKQSYEEVVTDISDKQLSVLTESVHDHLNDYLRKPFTAVNALGIMSVITTFTTQTTPKTFKLICLVPSKTYTTLCRSWM